jgi:hypothetical protein
MFELVGASTTTAEVDLLGFAIPTSSNPSNFVNTLSQPIGVTVTAETLAPTVYFSAATATNAVLLQRNVIRRY